MNRGLNYNSAGGQQRGINRSEVVVLAVQHEKDRVADQIAPTQRAVGLESHREQQSEQSREPDRRSEGVYKQCLLEEVGKRPQHHVAAFRTDAPNELNKRPVVLDVPEHSGKEDEEGSEPAEPDPLVEEDSALLRQEQADDDAEAEESNGVFLCKAKTREHGKPGPVSWTISLDGQDGEVGATHPQVGFETVCPQQASVGEVLRRHERADSAEEEGVTASSQFAGDCSSLHDQQGGGECRDKANAAQGVTQQGTADVDQERDQRGLVDVSPRKVITAGNVIEFVAEVAVAVVEVDMHQKIGEGKNNGDEHPIREEGCLLILKSRRRLSCHVHFHLCFMAA